MWGSSGDSPNQAASRFGIRKTDNTPHRFVIGGVPMELYFSPSDKTTSKLIGAVNGAVTAVNGAILSFTKDDLAQAMIAKKGAGKKVRIVLDNNTDSGNEFTALKNAGVDVFLKGADVSGLLHHKYLVIDAENPLADQIVVTGSHNWSSSAETSNNENTLLIHSKRIANLYLQEFKARYIGAGGKDSILVSVRKNVNDIPESFELAQNFPNPFNPATTIQFQIPIRTEVTLSVFDLLGREVATLTSGVMNPGTYSVLWDAGEFPSGVYLYRLTTAQNVQVRKLVLLK
jgi:hypothetical protein